MVTGRAATAALYPTRRKEPMDEAAIQALVEKRVAEILANRQVDEANQAAVEARQSEDKRVKDQALMRMSAAATEEARAEQAYKAGRYDRASGLHQAPAIQAAALTEAEIVIAEVYGE